MYTYLIIAIDDFLKICYSLLTNEIERGNRDIDASNDQNGATIILRDTFIQINGANGCNRVTIGMAS